MIDVFSEWSERLVFFDKGLPVVVFGRGIWSVKLPGLIGGSTEKKVEGAQESRAGRAKSVESRTREEKDDEWRVTIADTVVGDFLLWTVEYTSSNRGGT